MNHVNELTKEEFYKRYGDCKVLLERYWKFTFTFNGHTEDGRFMWVECGGAPDDIYRLDFEVSEPNTVRHLEPYKGAVSNADGSTDYFEVES